MSIFQSGNVRVDDGGVHVSMYYFPLGTRHVRFGAITKVQRVRCRGASKTWGWTGLDCVWWRCARPSLARARRPRCAELTSFADGRSLGCGREFSDIEGVIISADGCFEVGVSPPDVDGLIRALAEHGVAVPGAGAEPDGVKG